MMETYIAPPETRSGTPLTREHLRRRLLDAGLAAANEREQPPMSPGAPTFWSITLAESPAIIVHFQEVAAELVFATLEQSAFDETGIPDRVCRVLEDLGWTVDQENVG